MGNSSIRIAHVTDLHVLSLEGVRVWDFMNQRVLGGANLLFNRSGEYPVEVTERLMSDINAQKVDHVVVSGDLTNLSLPSELERARQVLSLLDLDSKDITVVPGNHDLYCLSERIRGNFRRVLYSYTEGDLASPHPIDRGRPAGFPFVRLRGPVAIVALSTAHVSPPLLATGSLGPKQLAAAEELLMHPEVRSRFRLVVMHHPPRGPYAKWQKRLTDGPEFLEMIQRTGAELIIHGHLHRELRDELPGPDGPVSVIGSNSSIWLTDDVERRASYNIYEVDDDGDFVGVERRVYDDASETYTT